MGKKKVLVVGGSGYIGRRIVKASLAEGHETYVIQRPEAEVGLQIEKVQMLLSFKKQGVRILRASFSDHNSLVDAVKKVDVVISAISGVHIRTHCITLQLKLVQAIKEAPNVMRFLPSEFGLDPARMGDALEPGRVTFEDKMAVRKAIEEANIPYTYISANLFAGYFAGSLSQMDSLMPPRDKVSLFGDGTKKAVFLDEDDVATYTIKAIDDSRTLNKTVYLRPPENILSQAELIGIWEKLIGKELEKTYIPPEGFLATLKGLDYKLQVAIGHFYHIFYEGCLTNFEIGEDGVEASKLYPEVNYTRMHEYLKIYA
ncbi:hypothetical protein Fmac_015165 [Flemingia macrophylla]|uniref:NmrA-like domain-containing protein n=1 Tax=Flemingia macrophylla TaxID=520843 RepID=A0ABD1MDW6_9FABA